MKHSIKVCKALALLMLMSVFPLVAMAQGSAITVKGQVTDEQGPIIGATVREKGAKSVAVTDIDGNYTIKVNPGATLTFTYLGYQNKEVSVGNRTRIDVTMESDAQALSELIPRMRILVFAPGVPELACICTPAARPWSTWSILVGTDRSICSELTDTTEPVTSERFIWP